MPSSYPGAIDTYTDPAGTSPLTVPDHAADHTAIHSAIGTIEYTLGTNSGTAILKNFTAGKFAARTTGETHGTSTWIGGTIGTATIGTSLIQGGTVNNVVVGSPAITGGTGNAMVLGTPTIGTITVPGTVLPLTPSAALSPSTAGSIADAAGGTITVNAQLSNVFFTVMGTAAGNRTIGTPLNPTAWQSLTYSFKASGSANGTLVWPSGAFTFSQDSGTPIIGTGVSWNYFGWRYNSVDSKWHFQGQSKNVI